MHLEDVRELIAANRIYEAWAILHDAHDVWLGQFVRYRLRNSRANPDEVRQDIWNAAYRLLRTCPTAGDARIWLITIACERLPTNTRRRVPTSLPEAILDVRALGRRPINVADVQRAIDSLNPGDRGLLELRYVERFDSTELATVFGTTPTRIEVKVSSFLRLVRERAESRPSETTRS